MAWRNYEVTVQGFPPFVLGATSRGRAMSEAHGRFSDPWPCTFGEFLKIARVRLCPPPGLDGYDYVRSNYGLPVRLGQRVRIKDERSRHAGREGEVIYPGPSTAHVHVLLDGEQRPRSWHPSDIEILEAA